ncbi:GNAT family N-acetyltransferase [Chitinophaga sp. YIM B06452]|uniref:GNAT family N-acetyltransferase n=1 Tax=Chitinophaga sp. YIM B06452 TaxID=3082158 RepID=UPI0031FE4C8F
MQIIKATTDHLPQLAVLFDLYRQHYEQQPDVEGAEQYLAERLVQNESVIYVAEEGGELVGFTQLYPVFSSIGMKKAWILNDLYVAENHRRKGAARGLLEASRELGKATDARYLMLQTHITNTKARALYESNGWKLDDEFYYYYLSI